MAATSENEDIAPNFGVIVMKIHSASNLPKMDVGLSKVDPYFKVKLLEANGEEIKFEKKTKTVSKNYNPTFDEKIRITGAGLKRSHPEKNQFLPKVRLELWDADKLSKDDFGGFAIIDLESFDKFPVKKYDVPLTLEDKLKPSKKAEKSTVKVSFKWMPDISLAEVALKKSGRSFYTAGKRHVFVDLDEELGAGVKLCAEFEKDKFDCHLVETGEPTGDAQTRWIELGYSRPRDFKVRRQSMQKDNAEEYKEWKIKGTRVYSSRKLDDLDADTHWDEIELRSSQYEQIMSFKMSEVTVKHGWEGSANYDKAKRMLKGIHTNDKKQALYFPIPGRLYEGEGETPAWGFLRSDFDSDNIDRAVMLFAPAEQQGIFFDITHEKRKKRTERHSKKPKDQFGHQVPSMVCVDDLKPPTHQAKINVRVLRHLSGKKVIRLVDIMPIFDSAPKFLRSVQQPNKQRLSAGTLMIEGKETTPWDNDYPCRGTLFLSEDKTIFGKLTYFDHHEGFQKEGQKTEFTGTWSEDGAVTYDTKIFSDTHKSQFFYTYELQYESGQLVGSYKRNDHDQKGKVLLKVVQLASDST